MMRVAYKVQVFVVGIVFLLASTQVSVTAASSKNRTLYILTLLPYPYYPDQQFNPSWSEGPQLSIALELAKEQINNQTVILPDYNIELDYGDCGCEYVDRAYEAIGGAYNPGANRMSHVGIIGPGCSSSSLEISSLTSREELSLVSIHGGGSPLLSNRATFPYSLGSLGSAEAFVKLTIKFMRNYEWKRIGILYYEVRQFYYSTARDLNDMLANLNDSNVKAGFFAPVYDETYIPLTDIMELGLRINILYTPLLTTQRILCLALSRGMVYPAYQWIITSNPFSEVATDISFVFEDQFYSCSGEEMRKTALNRVLFLSYQLLHINETQPSTYSSLTSLEYDELIRKKIDEQNNVNISYSVWTTYFYDSLWAWSVVLDRVTKRVPGLDLTQYQYGNTLVTNMFLDEFYSLNFEGVSGRIRFDNESGFLPRIVSVFQVIDGVDFKAGYFDGHSFIISDNFTLDAIEYRFPNQLFRVDAAICIILLIVVFIELLMVIILHVLTIKYRAYHSVKASSPKLSQLTFIGMYLFVFTIFTYVLRNYSLFDDFTTKVLCNLTWGWLLPISFTLTFGAVAVRTWRLYRIFTHYLNPGRFIADHYLMAFVFILLGVDVLLGTLWGAIDPQQVVYRNITVNEGPANFELAAQICISNNPFWSIALIFGFRVVIIVIVVVLTILTRKIKNQSFRTKTLRVLVYLTSIVMVVGFLIYYVLLFNSSPHSSADFIVIILMFNSILLLFIFLVCLPPLVPKLRELFYERFPHLVKTQQFDFEAEDESIPMEGSSRFYI